MLFGIAGPTASGKTTITDMLAAEYAAVQLRNSQILSEIAAAKGLDSTDKATLQNLYVDLRKERGEDWLSVEMAARAKASTTDHLIIEGNRRLVDLENLKRIANERNEELAFIFIDATPDTRFVRYNRRLEKQAKPPITREAFAVLEQNPAEDEVDDLRQYAKTSGIYVDTDAYDIEGSKELVRAALAEYQ